MRFSRFSVFFALLTWCISMAASAMVFSLSEANVNDIARTAFPQTRYYNDIRLDFSQPAVSLGADDDVGVSVRINATRGGQKLVAEGKLNGLLNYRADRKELQIEKPMLTDFTVLDNKLDDAAPLIDGLNQMKGQPLPMILLIDFTQIKLPLVGNQIPKRIDITNRQLVVEI